MIAIGLTEGYLSSIPFDSSMHVLAQGIGDDRFAIDNMNLVLIVRSFDWKLLL